MQLFDVTCARCELHIVRCVRVGEPETRRLTVHLRRCVPHVFERTWRPPLGRLLPYTQVRRTEG